MCIGTPLLTASLGCPAKSAQNMAETLKPDVLPPLWLQRKRKGLGLCCGWGGWRLLRVGRPLGKVTPAGAQDPARGAPHIPRLSPQPWLQKLWHCSPQRATGEEKSKFGLKSSLSG